MTRNDRSRPSVLQRLADIGWQQRTPLAAVCLVVLALGVGVALTSMQASEADVAAAGVAAPLEATDLPGSVAAQEEPQELHCPGTAVLRFDPGLGPTSQEQRVTGEMRGGTHADPKTPCTSPTGLPYQGGTADIQGSGEMACASSGAVADISGTADIVWDNGDTSKAVWSVVSYGAAPVVDIQIVEGALAPAQVYQQGNATGMNGNCADRPITSASFTGVAHVIKDGPEAPEATGALRE